MKKNNKRKLQNKVPDRFEIWYLPLMEFKTFLMQNKKETVLSHIGSEWLFRSIMGLYYSTFYAIVFYELRKESEIDRYTERARNLRAKIEKWLETDSFEVPPEDISLLSSYIDQIGKFFNTSDLGVSFTAIYEGSLNFDIYANFNNEKPIFLFIDYLAVSEQMREHVKSWAIGYKVMQEELAKSNFPQKK